MKNWKRWLKVIIILYCAIGIAFYYLQEKIYFRPVTLPENAQWHFSQPFIEKNIRYDAVATFNMIQFKVPDSVRKGIVLYFHGNRENINHYAEFADNFTNSGYEVWMPDYPGYGKSTGTMSEQILYEEALQVYKMARAQFPPDSIVIYGRSMGTGIASQLAAVRDCKRLILETPYYSYNSLFRRFLWMYPLGTMMQYKFPQNEYLTKVTAPVTVFHGTDDGVIPYGNASKLKTILKKNDEFITINGGSHNDLDKFALFHQKLDSLLK
jgi:alpha-beta hydrolase superfamily lysophospholipase